MHQIQNLYYAVPLTKSETSRNCQADEGEKKSSLLNYRCSVNSVPIDVAAASHASLSSFSESPARSSSPQSRSGLQDHHVCLESVIRSSLVRSPASASSLRNLHDYKSSSNNNISSKSNNKIDSLLNVVWRDDEDEEVDNSAAVARLSKDFDLMFGDQGDNATTAEYVRLSHHYVYY